MSTSDNNDDTLKKLLTGISEKISSEVERTEQKNYEDNKNLHDFIGVLGSSVQAAENLKDDDLYKLQLKEDKVKSGFLSNIKDLVQADIEVIKEKELEDKAQKKKSESKPLDDFISKLGSALAGDPLPEVEEPEVEEPEVEEPEVEEPEVEELEVEEPEHVSISDYVDTLDSDDTEPKQKADPLLGQIQEYVEDLFGRYKTQMTNAIGLGGGGGSVAVQYAKGGTIDGTLDITGQILSGGTDISTKFGEGGSGDLTKANADTYYVNLSGDTMTGSLSTLNLSASEVHTTSQIISAGVDISSLFGGGGTALTVKESDGSPSISDVATIEFDGATGLVVTDEGSNTAKISLGSHWKDIQVDGQTTLTPSGEESLEIEAGNNITLTTDTGTTPKKLTIAASSDLTKANADTYYVNLSGDTMTGSLSTINLSASEVHTTGQMLSAGVDISTLFGSGSLTKATADTYYVNLSGDTMTGSLSTINLSAAELHSTGQILSAGSDLNTLFDSNTLKTVELSGNKSGNRVTTQTLVLSGGPNINLISDNTNTISISGATKVSQLANDSGYMTGLVVATEAQILDSSQWSSINLVEGALALASDSGFFFSRIGDTINQHAHGFGLINPTATDIGIDSKADTKHSTMDANIIGLGTDYISDKYIFNSTLGDNSNSLPGGIKYDSATNGIFIYKNGAWRQILDGIKIKSDERDELEYLPEGKSYYIDVHTGDSDETDMAGTSIIQEYHTNIGAMQSSVVISGGTF
jgi:hypothetical protein